VLGSDVPELVDADFVGSVDVLEEVLVDVGVPVEVEDVDVNLVLAVLGGVMGFHASTLTLALLILVEVWEVDVHLVVELVVLDVEVVDDVLGFEDALVDVDVVELAVLGSELPLHGAVLDDVKLELLLLLEEDVLVELLLLLLVEVDVLVDELLLVLVLLEDEVLDVRVVDDALVLDVVVAIAAMAG